MAEQFDSDVPKTVDKQPTKDVAKTIVVFDVKPWDDTTDLDAMESAIRTIKIDGLIWGQTRKVPIAFGLSKLEIGCVIEDDKVQLDLIEEKITELEDYVQNIDVARMEKA